MGAVSAYEMEKRHKELDALTPIEREYVLALVANYVDEDDFRFAVGSAKKYGDRGPVYGVKS